MESGTPQPESIEPLPPTNPREIPPRIICPRCGYDLVGLLSDGHCPECGSANSNALNPYRLGNAAPAFLKRVHIGAVLLQVWVLVIWAKILIWDIFVGQVFMLPITFRHSTLAYICVQPILFVGLWLLSSRDPQSQHLPKHNISRKWIRFALITCMIAFAFLSLQWFDRGFAYIAARLPLRGIAMTTFACTFIMSIVYIRSVARKIPDDRFRRRVSLILYASIALLIIHYCTFPIAMAVAFYLGNDQAYTTAAFLYHVSWLAVYIPYFFLLNRTRLTLKGIRPNM